MGNVFELAPLTAPPQPSPPRRALAVLIALVFVGGVAAALLKPNDAPTQNAAALVRAASDRTASAGPSQFTGTLDITLNGVTNNGFMKMQGANDPTAHAASVSISAGSVTSEVRTIGGMTYFHIDGAPLPEGKSWVSFDQTEASASAQSAAASGDFKQQLQLLNALVGEPVSAGPETVDGVDVTHYRLTLDFTSLLDQMAKSGKALNANAMVKGLEMVHDLVDLTNIPGEVWLDDAGRAVEFRFSLHLEQNGTVIDEVSDMHFGHFGEPITVEPPAAEEVVPLSEVPDFFDSLGPH